MNPIESKASKKESFFGVFETPSNINKITSQIINWIKNTFGGNDMVKKLAICDECDFKGVANVIGKEDSDDFFWDCPNCNKRHKNEGTII